MLCTLGKKESEQARKVNVRKSTPCPTTLLIHVVAGTGTFLCASYCLPPSSVACGKFSMKVIIVSRG